MTQEERTRRYETMIVLRPDLQEAGTKEQLDRARRVIETHGGSVGTVHEWGVRELAYPIQKEHRGFYVLAEYLGTAKTVAELERHLKLSDSILRFISVRQPKDAPAVPLEALSDRPAPVADLDREEEEEGLPNETETGDLE